MVLLKKSVKKGDPYRDKGLPFVCDCKNTNYFDTASGYQKIILTPTLWWPLYA
jgi:hypothetical protein